MGKNWNQDSACLKSIFAEPELQGPKSISIQTTNGPSPHFEIHNLEAYPGYIQLRRPNSPQKPKGGNTRGNITKFTRKSRARMIKRMMSLSKQLLYWQTFTMPDDVFEGMDEQQRIDNAARLFHRFQDNIRHLDIEGIWRKENEIRKSGELKGKKAPHYHVMIYRKNLTEQNYKKLAIQLAVIWVKTLKTNHPKALAVAIGKDSYKWLHDHKMACAYVSKYMAKVEETTQTEKEVKIGRQWGKIGPLKHVKGIKLKISQATMTKLKRYLIRSLPTRNKKGKLVRKKLRKKILGQSIYVLKDIEFLIKILNFIGEQNAKEIADYIEVGAPAIARG